MIRTVLIAGFVVAASLIQPAQASSSPLFGAVALTGPSAPPLSLTCEHRSAKHIAEHGGGLEDSRYHIAHGELPNCDDEEQTKPAPVPHNEDDQNNQDDKKSRHCRKVWYC